MTSVTRSGSFSRCPLRALTRRPGRLLPPRCLRCRDMPVQGAALCSVVALGHPPFVFRVCHAGLDLAMCLCPAVFSWVASLSDAHVSICFSCEANRCFLDNGLPLAAMDFLSFCLCHLRSLCVCVSICGRGPALASHFHLVLSECGLPDHSIRRAVLEVTNTTSVQRRPKGCILRSLRFGSSMSVLS